MSKYKIIWDRFKLLIIISVLFCTTIVSLAYIMNSKIIGIQAGETLLTVFNNESSKLMDAYENGKRDGLSAKDTTAKLLADIISTENNKLEVLISSITLTDMHKSDKRFQKYQALYLFSAKVVFTVNMNEIEIINDDNGKIFIMVPNPEAEIFIDNTKTKKLAEMSNQLFDGSTEDGYTAYLNSMVEIDKNSIESISNYEGLMQMAQQSAISRIKKLAESICGYDVEFTISQKIN